MLVCPTAAYEPSKTREQQNDGGYRSMGLFHIAHSKQTVLVQVQKWIIEENKFERELRWTNAVEYGSIIRIFITKSVHRLSCRVKKKYSSLVTDSGNRVSLSKNTVQNLNVTWIILMDVHNTINGIDFKTNKWKSVYINVFVSLTCRHIGTKHKQT